jgi:hypothetical protein
MSSLPRFLDRAFDGGLGVGGIGDVAGQQDGAAAFLLDGGLGQVGVLSSSR